jgi:predicted metal-dependent phosphoesterase TrpH
MRIDFHVHTRYSPDSIIRPSDLARVSAKLGIIPAIADHNCINAHADMEALGARFIPAEEIFTDRGDLIGLYVDELVPKGIPFAEAIDTIHGQGGLAYLPHMYDYGRSKKHAGEKEAAKADIIEVFNARCLRKGYNERAAAFARTHRLPGAAGSDCHFLFEFGKTYTSLPDFDLGNPKALLKALKTRNLKLETHSAFPLVRGTTTFVAIGRKLAKRLLP